MTTLHLNRHQIISMFHDQITNQTAGSYIAIIKKAKTPFFYVERRKDRKYNLISGLKCKR
jgi:hypothetical protein